MSHSDWTGFPRTVISVAVALAALPALAQNTTSAVAGLVTGADGKPVAGASVQILHRESGAVTSASSGADGRYSARGLRVGGPYTITVSKDGKSDRKDDVFLVLAETLSLDMQLSGGVTTVVVTGQGAAGDRFGSSVMGAGTSVGSKEISTYASIRRGLQDYARTDPRLAQTDKEQGRIAVAGQHFRANAITIDGVTISDTFGLNGNNLPTLKQPVSIDAIQSVQVNVSNYDVTQTGYTGANINAVTKSGTNEFSGTVSYVFGNDDMRGDRYNLSSNTYTAPPYLKEQLKGFTLGGPIVKDKLFFFVGYEDYKKTKAIPAFGPVGDSRPNVAVTQTAIDQAIAISKDVYGFDVGTNSLPSGAFITVKDALLKLDWNISDRQRASLRYTKTDQVDPVFNNTANTSLQLSSNFYTVNTKFETTVAQWFADWTDTFSTEAKVSLRDYAAPSSTPDPKTAQVALNFLNALPAGVPATTPNNRNLFLGTERSRHFNDLSTKTTDIYFAGNLNLGAHEVKAGLGYSTNKVYNAFLQDTNGNYVVRCLNSSATVTYTSLPGGINCGTASAADVEKALLENFQRGRVFQYTAQVPLSGKAIEDGAARWELANTALFAQDTWTVSKNLTLQFGVRIDRQEVPDAPVYNEVASGPLVAGDAALNKPQSGGFGLDNRVTIDGAQLVQPRVGFNYQFVTADNKRQQLRGGLGLFQGAAAGVWLSNPFSNTGAAVRNIGCGGSFPACPTTDGFLRMNKDQQYASLPGSVPAANVDFIDPGLEQPSVWKANLAFESQLPWFGLTAGAEWLHTETNQGLYYRNLNLGPARAEVGVDGRPLFWNVAGLNPACWTATGAQVSSCSFLSRSLRNQAFNNVLVATGTKKGEGDALTLTLNGSAPGNVQWSLAYTRTAAKEVNPLTSSVSNSNWANRAALDPNEEVAANAATLIKDRFNSSVSWSKAFIGEYRTSVGVFYEGRRGLPYSWTFANDANGDGVTGNDLVYIPTAPGSGEVIFRGGAADEAKFWEVVDANPALRNAKGQVVRRNSAFAPWINTFDLRIRQEVPGFTSKQRGVLSFDILNFGNLLNKKWGRTDESPFVAGLARSFVAYNGIQDGKYVYSSTPTTPLVTRQNDGESQWALQISLKYEF